MPGRSVDVRLSEDELLRQSRDGNLAAFEELVRLYDRKVYSIAYRFMGSADDAADMAQESFLRLYKTLNAFRGDSSFNTWIYHIVANICRDELRKRGRMTLVGLEDNSPTGYSQNQPEGIFLGKEQQGYLNSLIMQLPDEYRVVVVMREIMAFSYEEIAGVLSCSLGTVKSRLSRSRKLLRDRILAEKVISIGAIKGGSST